MPDWNLHHCYALCQGCDWTRRKEGPGPINVGSITGAARVHARETGHYVQVERAEHLHLEGADA